MRTGVLADSNAKHFQPMDFVSHERHLGLPHIPKTKVLTKLGSVKQDTDPRLDHEHLILHTMNLPS